MTGLEPPTITLSGLIGEVRASIARAGIDDSGLEARLLVGGLMELSGAELVMRAHDPVAGETAARIRAAMAERVGGKPVHRILGAREFYGLRLALSADTLEPRPDTETLVEVAIPLVRRIVARKGTCALADLGTGTGAIGLAILTECPGATCLGVDRAPGAVATAAENARALGLSGRFRAVQGDWLEGISESFDIIVSNPPYIPRAEISELADEVRLHDPLLALDGGIDGLDAYRAIAAVPAERVGSGGYVLVEIGIGQTADVTGIFVASGFRHVRVFPDLAGIDRAILFERT